MSPRLLLVILFSGSTVADFSDYEDAIQGKQKTDSRSKISSKDSQHGNNAATIGKKQRTPTRSFHRNVPHARLQVSAEEVADFIAFQTVHPTESRMSVPNGLSSARVDKTKRVVPYHSATKGNLLRTPSGTMSSRITAPGWNNSWPTGHQYRWIASDFENHQNANEKTRRFRNNPYAYTEQYSSSYYYYSGYYSGYFDGLRNYLMFYPQYYYG